MYVPFELHAGQKNSLPDFIRGVKEAFHKSIEAYERTVENNYFAEDMNTTTFSFSVFNGGYAEALLQDANPHSDKGD